MTSTSGKVKLWECLVIQRLKTFLIDKNILFTKAIFSFNFEQQFVQKGALLCIFRKLMNSLC